MQHSLELILASRLVAILRLDDLKHAVDISQALLRAGIVAQEFTLTNPDALSALRGVIEHIAAFSEGTATVGVGSVRTHSQATAAVDAGAQFLVTPILSRDAIQAGVKARVPVVSGAYSPTEIALAWELGASIVKVFPARGLGPNYIRDVLAPLPELKLMPTGGIDLENMESYFAAGAVAVGIGGNLLEKAALADSDWDKITSTAKRFAQLAARQTSGINSRSFRE